MTTAVSPLAPAQFPDMPTVAGVRLATAAAGIRYPGRTDVLLALFQEREYASFNDLVHRISRALSSQSYRKSFVSLHLDEKWAYNAVKQVGNYGEIFDRNVGKDSPLKLDRGVNALWSNEGLMYAMPIR